MAGHQDEGAAARQDVVALREELGRLAQRIAALEAAAEARALAPAGAATASAEGAGVGSGRDAKADAGVVLPEETLLAIVAAVAAYLGKRPRIRAIQLLDSAAWARAGRVTIQASHILSHYAGTGGTP